MGIFALGSLGSKLITFLLLPLYTHVLSDAEYGIADLVFTIGQLLLPVVSLAIFNGLLRFGLMKDNTPEDALRCATEVFFFGSIVAIIITPLLHFIPSIGEWSIYLCGYVISSFAVSNGMVYLKVKDKNKIYSALSILQTLTLVIFNIVFLILLKLGIQGYLLSYILSNLITAIATFIFGKMYHDLKLSKRNMALLKAMVAFSIPYILNDISWWAIHSVNKILIEIMLGSAILGIFTAASKIPSLINTVASIFTQAWGISSIKEHDSTNDTSFYAKVFDYFLVFVFGACIAANTIMKPFMKLYVSDEFFSAWHYVPLLLLGAVFSAIASFMGSLLGAAKKTKNLMISTLIASVVNVIVSYVLIKFVGLWGAVIGTLLSYIVVAVCRMFEVRKYIVFNYGTKKLIALSIVTLCHAVLLGMDYHIIWVSIAAIVLYIGIIFPNIKHAVSAIREKLSKKQ